MKMASVAMVTERLQDVDYFDQDAYTLDSLISSLTQMREEYKARGYVNVRIVVETAMEDPNKYILFGDRPETEKETARRLERERKAREAKKLEREMKVQSERAVYERLHKKYGHLTKDVQNKI